MLDRRGFHSHFQLVFLPVEHRRRKAQRIQTMQFLRDSREGRRELVGLLQLEVATAGLFGELSQSTVRPGALQSDAVEELRLRPMA